MTIVKKTYLLLLLLSGFTAMGTAQQTVQNPDPLRFEDQINSFMDWDGILFVGSSSIRMWNTHQAFPEFPIINRGFGGSHISDVQYYYDQVIAKYNPALVVFYAGDNDIAAGKPVDQVFENYKDLTDMLLSDHPDLMFIYLPIKPSSSRWNHWEEMNKVNNLILDFNSDNNQLFYVDLATPLLNAEGRPDDSFFLEDQLHLNQKGYDTWNQVFAPVLEEIYSLNAVQ